MVPQAGGRVHAGAVTRMNAAGKMRRSASLHAPASTAVTAPTSSAPGLTYRDAGVDIDAGNEVVERIKPLVRATMRPEVLGGVGLFGGLFDLSGRYREPVLVSGTDGVGTKLKLAFRLKKHDTIGIDLVAMCVNDLVVQGAEPLFFLDYFATGKQKPLTRSFASMAFPFALWVCWSRKAPPLALAAITSSLRLIKAYNAIFRPVMAIALG